MSLLLNLRGARRLGVSMLGLMAAAALWMVWPWTGHGQLPAGAQVLKDLPYVTGGHERQKLDLYLPAHGDTGENRPVLVWIHGGAWTEGSKNYCPAVRMVEMGYAVASINYRLSQHAVFPAQLEDCKSAIRWLRAHASEYKLAPDRIGVAGESAGGHLAALVGVTGQHPEFDKGENLKENSRVNCVLDWYGPTDFLHWGPLNLSSPDVPDKLDGPFTPIYKLLGGRVREKVELARVASPLYAIEKGCPAFLIMHGDKDPIVPLQQSEVLYEALTAAGVADCSLVVLPGAGHGGAAFGAPEQLKRIVGFFETHLGATAVTHY